MKQCKVCGKLFQKITNTHLGVHNLSRRQYDKIEHATPPPIVVTVQSVGRKICRVCGKTLLRLTKHHLSLHKMTREEYFKLPPYGLPSGQIATVDESGRQVHIENIDNLIPQIRDIILNRENVDDQTKRCIEQLVRSKESEFKTLVTAYAMNRVNRLMNIIDSDDRIRETLFSEARITGASTRDLLSMKSSVTSEIDRLLALFERLAGMLEGEQKPRDVFNTLINVIPGKVVPEDPYRREKLSKKFRQLTSLVEKVENES